MPTVSDTHLDSARTALDVARRAAHSERPEATVYAIIAVAEGVFALVAYLRDSVLAVSRP